MTNSDIKLSSSERLAFLYRTSQAFNASLKLDDVLSTVMDEIIKLTGAERGFLMLFDEAEQLIFQVARGIDQTTIENPESGISQSIVEKVAKSGNPIFTLDAQNQEELSSNSIINLKLRSIMCTPLKVNENILGVVYVDNKMISSMFNEDDLDLLNAIASNAASAIENARLYQLAVEKGKMEQDLQVAKKVQSGLIPQSNPEISGWDIASYWDPAKEVAGDFFDFIKNENGKHGMLIADVVDKGIAAALYMAFSRSTLRAILSRSSAPKEGILEANKLICNDSAYGMFLTLAFLEVDDESGDVIVVNAGHNPPLLYKKSEDKLIPLTRTGMLMGVDNEASYGQSKLNLDAGDFIVSFTDGIPEAINEKEEEFGDDRFEQAILANKNESSEDLKNNLLASLNDFIGDTPQFDDITLLITKRK